jgi:hypothetical protein
MRVNKKYGFLCLLSFALIIQSNQGISQKIDFRLSSIDSLNDTSVNEIIKDINGDTCSIINLKTSLDSIKFYSNLGVERVQKNESGYRVWIPSRSGSIKLIIPRFPLSEYIIPASSYKYSVYNLELAVSELQNIIYTDTVKPALSFMVSPDRSRIIINGKFAGRSPYIVQNPEFFDFDYKIKRRGYETYVSRDSFDVRIRSIPVTLNSLYKS